MLKCLVIVVFIAVIEAEDRHLLGTVSDDLEFKPEDLLSSLSSEIAKSAKSDVEITLSGIKFAEDPTTSAIDAIYNPRSDKTPENYALTRSDLKSTSNTEETQKITHTSDNNASFIHVKEKIARQGSNEEVSGSDDKPKDENNFNSKERSGTQQALDDLKNADKVEKGSQDKAESRTPGKEEIGTSEAIDSVEAEDFDELLKYAPDDDIDATTQSRRMLSFDPQLLEGINITIEGIEPLLAIGAKTNEHVFSGANEYEHVPDHHNHAEYRDGKPFEAAPIGLSSLNIPTLPPLALFHSTGAPLQRQNPPSDNIARHSPSLDKIFPEFPTRPRYNVNRHQPLNQHYQPNHNLFSHHYEPAQPLQTYKLPQPLQFDTSLLQPQIQHSLESWPTLQHYPAIDHPLSSYVTPSPLLSSKPSFQPPPVNMDNLFSRLRDVSTHPVYTDASNQFSDLFQNSWNVGGYNTFTGV